MSLTLQSPSFPAGASIPERFTCEGENLAPALSWSGAPEGTRSFALIVEDPDAPDPRAPKLTYTHWVVCDIPATTHALAEGGRLPAGAREGRNDWSRLGYGGPCPPIGRHRYIFKLFALDTLLPTLRRPTKAELERALDGHVLDRTQLIGTYEKHH